MKRLIAVCLLMASTWSGLAKAIEEPQFQLLDKSSTVEMRQYKSMLVAEVQVDGSFKDASAQGFRLLADYILGKNTARLHPGGEKIAMTAPFVVQSALERPAGAPMTAQDGGSGRWQVQFFIPAQYTLATVPAPLDARITLRQLPPRRLLVLVFSGLAGEDKVNKKTEELWRWVGTKNLSSKGAVQLARYNSPWTVPFWRRNELWLEIE